jgi:hypothetical protein
MRWCFWVRVPPQNDRALNAAAHDDFWHGSHKIKLPETVCHQSPGVNHEDLTAYQHLKVPCQNTMGYTEPGRAIAGRAVQQVVSIPAFEVILRQRNE